MQFQRSQVYAWNHFFKLTQGHQITNLAGIYLLKVNNRNTKTRCEICSKLIMKTPERRPSVSVANFEQVKDSKVKVKETLKNLSSSMTPFWCFYC